MAEEVSTDTLDVTICDFQFVHNEHAGLYGGDVDRA
jgi:hypothetical protein